jgi:hypothetical protein
MFPNTFDIYLVVYIHIKIHVSLFALCQFGQTPLMLLCNKGNLLWMQRYMQECKARGVQVDINRRDDVCVTN